MVIIVHQDIVNSVVAVLFVDRMWRLGMTLGNRLRKIVNRRGAPPKKFSAHSQK